MARFTDPLSHVRVAAPCRADWEKMHGNERVRFCGECSMNVYNLSNMSKKDAEALILNAEGRLCVRYYNRSDGTILTQNCLVGLQAFKRRVSGISKAIASSVLSFFAGMAVLAGVQQAQDSLNVTTEVGIDLIDPVPLVEEEAAPPEETFTIMGGIAFVDEMPQRQNASDI
ncbi:MAG TPA: hypothetical protein VGO96_14980 [Pyrinomonadaceae bacterium]|jgi:hypothetical protein|nr:hypothetical protein [Pyrinomonadaceae bacterium]